MENSSAAKTQPIASIASIASMYQLMFQAEFRARKELERLEVAGADEWTLFHAERRLRQFAKLATKYSRMLADANEGVA